MGKRILVLALIVGVSLLLLSGCTKSQPTGYATYQGQQQGQQAAIGGGCGVSAPADDTGAANSAANAGAASA